MPIISVIMPVYNAEKYLRKAIDSIINQTFWDWELILINDGSTDGSEGIITSYSDARIRYYQNENNLGLIKTLNTGIDLCRGHYIARMDADDISEPARFELQSRFLDTHPDYAMCGSYASVINERGEQTGHIVNFAANEYIKVHLLFSVPFVHPSMMMRSDALKENRFDEAYKHAEDYELWCRIADRHKVANIPQYLLKYRWHSSNVSVLNSQVQIDVKHTIIRRELSKIGLDPSQQELYLHTVSFLQNDAKIAVARQAFTDFMGLDVWFSKIIKGNTYHKKYDPQVLMAYLWSRWIVLCISQKRFTKILKPCFFLFSMNVIAKTLRLLLFFRKK